MSDSVRPHRWQPTRLPRPWDSPGKNTGVGCHFLLQGMKVKSESEVAQSCPTLSDPMDCSPPGSSVRGIFQARVLEWGAIASSFHVLAIVNSAAVNMGVPVSFFRINFIFLATRSLCCVCRLHPVGSEWGQSLLLCVDFLWVWRMRAYSVVVVASLGAKRGL